ncbi:Hypothetical predicted protein [Mytilus galloprovincialis]|uniref:RNase H type-1 domain-containing protein n=1 Tax=Mytilus galloprovincialis TaxID=29158 RepID=A0A8B6BM73_MYTGA|nr:Hypothetical predicted protein [Mytilus galloprovincialis]
MEEISVREIAKIQSKYKAELIKHQLEEYLTNNETYERQESPFGSSKNSTAEPTAQSKQFVQELIGESSESTAIAFTDGSCQGNPGTCGAGAVIYTANHQGTSLNRPVASRGSILLAELIAILMVLEHCIYTLREQFTENKDSIR